MFKREFPRIEFYIILIHRILVHFILVSNLRGIPAHGPHVERGGLRTHVLVVVQLTWGTFSLL
jgi:hypothetical protein